MRFSVFLLCIIIMLQISFANTSIGNDVVNQFAVPQVTVSEIQSSDIILISSLDIDGILVCAIPVNIIKKENFSFVKNHKSINFDICSVGLKKINLYSKKYRHKIKV